MQDAEFAVVGAGVMGTATSWALSKRNREVVLLEQFEVGHTRGSSHGRSRVFRFSYEEARYVRMAMEAVPLWREIESEAGVDLLTMVGGLDFGGDLGPNIRALRECGATFQVLGAAEATERFPQVSLPAQQQVLYQADAGIVAAGAAVRAFLDAGKGRGVEIHESTPVLDVTPIDHGIRLRTSEETYRVRRAVVTAGAWAAPLLRGAGIDLPVEPTRETVAYFDHREEMALPVQLDRGSPMIYALPDPRHGLKAGAHHTGPPANPNEHGAVSEEIADLLADWVARHYPHADPRPSHAETCLYTNTSDERFILERHGAVVVGSACSGHGFKFAPLIGERLAALALT
jgi:sarcosine oxidase